MNFKKFSILLLIAFTSAPLPLAAMEDNYDDWQPDAAYQKTVEAVAHQNQIQEEAIKSLDPDDEHEQKVKNHDQEEQESKAAQEVQEAVPEIVYQSQWKEESSIYG